MLFFPTCYFSDCNLFVFFRMLKDMDLIFKMRICVSKKLFLIDGLCIVFFSFQNDVFFYIYNEMPEKMQLF